MAWDTDKNPGDLIKSQDWDDMVADQKSRAIGSYISGTNYIWIGSNLTSSVISGNNIYVNTNVSGGSIRVSSLTNIGNTTLGDADSDTLIISGTLSLTQAGVNTLFVSGNKVGIGTTPTSLLDVRLATDSDNEIAKFINPSATTDGRETYIDIGTDNGNNLSARWKYVHDTTVGDRFMNFNMFGEANGVGLVVRQGGNVGIGTTSPTSLLHLSATSGTIQINPGNGTAIIRSTNEPAVGGQALKFQTRSASPDLLNTDRFVITGAEDIADIYFISGNVGIGTTSPTHLLHISGTSSGLRFDASGVAPSDTVTADIWLNVSINGTLYKLPGYLP